MVTSRIDYGEYYYEIIQVVHNEHSYYVVRKNGNPAGFSVYFSLMEAKRAIKIKEGESSWENI